MCNGVLSTAVKELLGGASEEGKRLKLRSKTCPWSLWEQLLGWAAVSVSFTISASTLILSLMFLCINACYSWHWTCLRSCWEDWRHHAPVPALCGCIYTQPQTMLLTRGIDTSCGSALSASGPVLRAMFLGTQCHIVKRNSSCWRQAQTTDCSLQKLLVTGSWGVATPHLIVLLLSVSARSISTASLVLWSFMHTHFIHCFSEYLV